MVGTMVITVGLFLFLIAKSVVQFWYVYPAAAYVIAAYIIPLENINGFGNQEISPGLVTAIGLGATYCIIYFCVLLFQFFTGEYRKNTAALCYLLVLLVVPLAIAFGNRWLLTSLHNPPPPRLPQVSGVAVGAYSDKKDNDWYHLEYPDFTVSRSENTSEGYINKKYSVVDFLKHRVVPLGARHKNCSQIYTVDEVVSHYQKQMTGKGNTYHVGVLQRVITKKSGGEMIYAKVLQYCFYISPYEYRIERELPNANTDPQEHPITLELVNRAYEKYPIDTIIDSAFKQ